MNVDLVQSGVTQTHIHPAGAVESYCDQPCSRSNTAGGKRPTPTTAVAPQWRVIELVTIAHVQLLADDRGAAEESLDAAVREAVMQRLPHQLQRVMRVAGDLLPEIRIAVSQALERLRNEIAA